jgi:two-component system response regulator HydG
MGTTALHRVLSAHRGQRSPLIGVVAGSGLVARSASEAGADLLFALNAGLYRNLGSGSFAAFLPYGNANDQTEAMLREHILPRRGAVPVVAGVLASDPFGPTESRLENLSRLGVEGVINWPTVGFVDGRFRAALEAEGYGVESELRMLARAREMGFATFGFAVGDDRSAERFAASGVDAMILGLGLTHEVEDVRQRRDQIQRTTALLNAMLAGVRRTGNSPVCLAYGGPVTTAEDLEQILAHTAIDGFAGGSVFERLALESTITSLVRRFKGLILHAGDTPHPAGSGLIIGACAAMRLVQRRVERVAPYDVSVCIEGESGTGKEVAAAQIHLMGPRRQRAFVTLNCGAIPGGLLESELFGHEKGAFTGADRQRPGKFELAHGGTLFLDEIADMSPQGQVALLRAIQQREITRVGGDRPLPVDVRILAASNRPLAELVEQGRFRADLYYRLNGITIQLPPLRHRLEDIPLLVEHILGRVRVRFKRKIRGLSPGFFAKINGHDWPGNIRELEQVVIQAAMLEDGPILEGEDFRPVSRRSERDLRVVEEAACDPGAARREVLRAALREADGNKTRAAAILGITRRTLYAWLRDSAVEKGSH